MKKILLASVTLWAIAFPCRQMHAQEPQSTPDTSPHRVQFIEVEKGVKLEVLDWGGNGRPLIFLAGLGRTAHDFDTFAPKFTAHNHVYAITRRGFGASSKPAPTAANYAADRLGDDVLAVIAALKLNRPVLAGHSIAGEELSSIGSRHPEKVAGLIYLDAALPFAYYNPRANSDWVLDMLAVKRRIDALQAGAVFDLQFAQGMLASTALLQKDMQDRARVMAAEPNLPGFPPSPSGLAVMFGAQVYTEIHDPSLAIFACPTSFDFIRNNPALKAAMVADFSARCTAQSKAFQAGVPFAKVVLIPNAEHDVFNSNQADVLRDMSDFIAGLP